jgi:hypothetical protein
MRQEHRPGQPARPGHSPSTRPGAPTPRSLVTCWPGCGCSTWDGELALAEPDTLRYTLLHTSAKIVRGQRKRTLKIPETWPWAHQLAEAIDTVLALPNPT